MRVEEGPRPAGQPFGGLDEVEIHLADSIIRAHRRWKSLAMVFRYWRRGSDWSNNALDGVGLRTDFLGKLMGRHTPVLGG
ncbi:hypothetical protein GCM10010411_75460 [Actinomadura fulvescens]|uniref:Transposase n=1 Tax=Actinomadura fulvescens TaxID=46160 RepID=A0ABP6CV86_9ACTN